MSGGIDSSVAAIILQEKGYEVVGITMLAFDYSPVEYDKKYSVCCNDDTLNDVRSFAKKLGFEHHTIDIKDKFKKSIIDNFISEYLSGHTPNPCALCNPLIRWRYLMEKAGEFNCDYVSTGHYARTDKYYDRYIIKTAKDSQKDQSYFLWGLSQEMIKNTIFPMGDFTKSEIKQMAKSKGFPDLSEKSESMEVCFIPDNDYRKFLKDNVADLKNNVPEGNFVSTDGKILGTHKGFPFYTIGQRKGLEIAVGHPLYVNKIHPDTNTVVLGTKEELNRNEFFVEDTNFIKYETLPGEPEVKVRIRYNTAGVPGTIKTENGRIKVSLKKHVSAVAPGQSAVFFEGEDILGGGIIV